MEVGIKIQSVSFYQSIRLGNNQEYNTVHVGLARMENLEVAFLKDKVFMRNKDWVKKESGAFVHMVGITNVRNLKIGWGDFKECDYKNVFGDLPEEVKEKITIEYSNKEMKRREFLFEACTELNIKFDTQWSTEQIEKLVEEATHKKD